MASIDQPPAPRRWQVFSTMVIVVLAVVGTLLGLLRDGFYRDPFALVYQAYGQDTVTLVIVTPLLVFGLWLALRRSLRGYVLWLGTLGYMLYTYAVYAVITQFNQFFLGYVALFGLSFYTLIGGLLQLDANAVKRRLKSDLPVRLMAGFLAAMGVLVALLWLSEVLPATITNTKPASAADVGLPANVVHVLDLAILIPSMFVTARWLAQRRPWGYVFPGVLFVKLTSIGLAILAMIAWMALEGEPVPAPQIVVFVVLTVVNGAFGVKYLLAIDRNGGVQDQSEESPNGD